MDVDSLIVGPQPAAPAVAAAAGPPSAVALGPPLALGPPMGAAPEAPPSAADARFQRAFDVAPGGMVLLDQVGVIVHANRAIAELIGIDQQALVGRHSRALVDDESFAQNRAALRRLWSVRDTLVTMQWQLIAAGGHRLPVEINAANVMAPDGGFDVVMYTADLRERMRIAAKVEHLTRIDAVTGLYNRRAIHQRLESRLADATAPVALLVVDIDRFQAVNDRLGHTYGDQVLATVGGRLSAIAGASDVGRLGADEYAVIVSDVDDPDDPVRLASHIRSVVAQPIRTGDTVLHLSASIGIATDVGGGADAASLVQRADIAPHRARRTQRWVDVADTSDADAVKQQLQVEAAVPDAVSRRAMDVAFQPIYDVDDEIRGVEVLLRPHDQTLSPFAFVQAAERSSLIVDVGRFVLQSALSHIDRLSRAAGRQLHLSINISARELQEPRLIDSLLSAAAQHGFDPARLCLELTESAALEDTASTIEALHRLRAAGVRVSIDDFGIGYSSFSYLRDLPIDEVKIDRSFLARVADDHSSVKVLAGMVGLCQAMGFSVVCEGVETRLHRRVVHQIGASLWQGYLGSRALPADQLCAYLEGRRATKA